MASEASGTTGGDAAVSSRIHNVKVKLDNVEAAQSSAKWTARAVTLVLVLAILAGIYLSFVVPISDAVDNSEEFQKAMTAQVEKMTPEIQEELNLLLEDLKPHVEEVIEPRIKDKWLPEVQMAAEEELAKLGETLHVGVTERITTVSTDLQNYATTKLKRDIPQLNDQDKTERMIANMGTAMNNVVERVMGEHFGAKVDMVVAIETELTNFPVPEKIKAMDDDQLSQYMNELMMSYVSQQFESILTSPEGAASQLKK